MDFRPGGGAARTFVFVAGFGGYSGDGKGENAGRSSVFLPETSGKGRQVVHLPQVPHDDCEA